VVATGRAGSFGRFAVPRGLVARASRRDPATSRTVPDAPRLHSDDALVRDPNAARRPMSPSGSGYPDVIEVVVEIPRGSRNKYEWDAKAGVFRLDRVLSSAVFYNFDYGYTVDTISGDGDPTDILLLIDEPTFPGCHVWARPIGGLEMRDEKGPDFKVLCVAIGDPHQQHVERLDQVRPHRLVEIENFFQTYKLLEDKTVEVVGWKDAAEARRVLNEDRVRFGPRSD
jgi:inorganic pyrophosphatase